MGKVENRGGKVRRSAGKVSHLLKGQLDIPPEANMFKSSQVGCGRAAADAPSKRADGALSVHTATPVKSQPMGWAASGEPEGGSPYRVGAETPRSRIDSNADL